MYRFSIIVPTLNRRRMLEAALSSIEAQRVSGIEIIVVDGGSTDGTVEALRERCNIRLLTGPDAGVYDAINKGIASATGDVIGLLNSDDRYEPGALNAIKDALRENPDAHAACGVARLFEEERLIAVFDAESDQTPASPWSALIGPCVPNAHFFRRDAIAQIGSFSLDYRFVADRDWMTRWYEAGLKIVSVRLPVYCYQQHANSLTYDPGRRNAIKIRMELFALARRWRTDLLASARTRDIAALLEGRCRAKLALGALFAGNLSEAARWLVYENEHVSMFPLSAITRASLDWLAQKRRERFSS